MKKILSFAAIAALATSSFGADDLVGAFKDGKVSGQIRTMYIKNDYSSMANNDGSSDDSAFALGGKLGFETAPLYGISAGAVFYTAQDLGTMNQDPLKVDGATFDRSGSTNDRAKSYSLLGQAYLQGQFDKTTVKIGRQQLDTPLAGSYDVRAIPNLFEAALLINTNIPRTTLIGGYVSKMAGFNSASNSDYVQVMTRYLDFDTDPMTSRVRGYGNFHNGRTAFQSMSRSALGNLVDVHGTVLGYSTIENPIGDKGVYTFAAISKPIENFSLQLWEYYAVDLLNAVYAQADYKIAIGQDTAISIATQGYKIENIGKTKNLLKSDAIKALGYGKMDYYVYGAKVAVDTPIGLTPYVAYNKVSEQKDGILGGTFAFGAWGGYPEFAIGEEMRYNSFGRSSGLMNAINGASVWKAGVDFGIKKLGLGDRTLGVSYIKFDLKDNYNLQGGSDNYTIGENADTNVWDIKYTCKGALVKNLDATLLFESVDSKNNMYDKKTAKATFNYNF